MRPFLCGSGLPGRAPQKKHACRAKLFQSGGVTAGETKERRMADRAHALIIEDELVIALGLQAQLSDLGYGSFAFASTDLQALEQARMQCPALVTVDVGLLDGNGLDAIDGVLSLCGPLPVIYITGDGAALDGYPEAVVVEKPVSDHALALALIKAKAAPARRLRAYGAEAGPEPRTVI